MMMTEHQLKARREMYAELARCLRLAKQTKAKHTIRAMENRAALVQRAIDLLNSGDLSFIVVEDDDDEDDPR